MFEVMMMTDAWETNSKGGHVLHVIARIDAESESEVAEKLQLVPTQEPGWYTVPGIKEALRGSVFSDRIFIREAVPSITDKTSLLKAMGEALGWELL